jgi:hypothetical protein
MRIKALLIFVLIFAAPVFALEAPVVSSQNPVPHYVKTADGLCSVWNPKPSKAEAAQWQGACVQGYASGKGILTWQQNGITTEVFEAQFVHGKVEGATNYHNVADKYWLVGNFHNGHFEGQGSFRDEVGDFYSGSILHNEFQGQGTLHYANGDMYIGRFARGLPNGMGKMTLASGKVISGVFADGELVLPPALKPIPAPVVSLPTLAPKPATTPAPKPVETPTPALKPVESPALIAKPVAAPAAQAGPPPVANPPAKTSAPPAPASPKS